MKPTLLVALVAALLGGCIIVPVGDGRGYYRGSHGYERHYRGGYYSGGRWWRDEREYRYGAPYYRYPDRGE